MSTIKKDKFGYEIPDKYNKVRISTENKSGTWKDDEYEDLLYDLLEMIEQRYPDSIKYQKSIICSLITCFTNNLVEKEIERHEDGLNPHYVSVCAHIRDVMMGLESQKQTLLEQREDLINYLTECDKLVEEEANELEKLKDGNS